MENDVLRVFQSGRIFIIKNGEQGCVVRPAQNSVSPWQSVGSIVAHVHVYDPWVEVTGSPDLPQLVLDQLS